MTYTIQQVSKKTGVSSYSIRYYDDHGLIPEVSRDENNNRVFNTASVEWVEIVACLRSADMPLANIKHYVELCLDGEQTVPERYRIMVAQQRKLLEQQAAIQNHLNLINKKIDHYASVIIEHKPDTMLPSNDRPDVFAQSFIDDSEQSQSSEHAFK